MENIKFRAYDIKKNRYVDTGEITFHFYGDTRVTVTPNEMAYGTVADYEHDVLNGRFIIEQFTGLKDAQGQELYIGDIIANCDQKEVIEDIFTLGYRIHECTIIDGGFHIIGNIHEHKHLLDEK